MERTQLGYRSRRLTWLSTNDIWIASAKMKRHNISADCFTETKTKRHNRRKHPMYIEYWSREEIEEYCENPNLLIAKAHELRSKVIRDLLVQAINRISIMLKQLIRQPV